KLDSGLMLGLWARQTVAPRVLSAGRAGELAIPVADRDTVRALHADWTERGIPIAQPPTDLDIGHTFVALDPDGHRLRVIAPRRDSAWPPGRRRDADSCLSCPTATITPAPAAPPPAGRSNPA